MKSENLLLEAYEQVSEDDRFVRITTATTFLHSIIFLVIVLNNINFFINNTTGKWVQISNILKYTNSLFIESWFTGAFIILLISLAAGYFLLYPIGEATLIYYLDNDQKDSRWSFLKWLNKFFLMFEFIAMNGMGFNLLSFWFITMRIYIAWVLDNPFVITILAIWLIIILFLTFLRPYTKFAIVLEDMEVMQAIWRSIELTTKNISMTVKFVIIWLLLQLRFIVNTALIIGIPIGMIFIATSLDIIDKNIFNPIIYSTIAILFLITAYINGIIEAFFITYRYKLYKKIS